LPSFYKKLADSSSTEYTTLLNSFKSGVNHLQHAVTLEQDGCVTVLGKPKIMNLKGDHNLALHTVITRINRNIVVKYYKRFIVIGKVVHSFHYCRNLKRNSYTVQLLDLTFFSIETFVVADLDGNVEACYAIGHYFNKLLSPLCRIIFVQKIALSHIVVVAKH